jgi:hypothetical protein
LTITINHISEFSALAASIVFWNYIKKGKLKSLPFFLLFILLVELTGNYLRKNMYPNVGLYNCSIPVEYCYYLFLFYLHGGIILKRLSKWAGFGVLCFAIFYFFKLPATYFHSYVLVAGQVSVIICSCIYLYEQFQHPGEQSLLKNYFFWIVAGLLLFNLGDLTYSLLYPIIHTNKWDRFDIVFKKTNNSLLVLLYLSYIISIVVYKKQNHVTGSDAK